jgi:hypothetical protein
MASHVVIALHLNLRSAPDPTKKNVLAVLPQGSLIDKVANSPVSGWFEVDAVVAGVTLRGHLNSNHLGPLGSVFPSARVTGGSLPAADLGSKSTERRSVTGSRAYSIQEAGKPGRPSAHPGGAAAGIVAIIDWMNVGSAAHLRWQGSGGKTFCNIYTYDVCDTAGCYIPRVWWTSKAITDLQAGAVVEAKYGATVTEMRANYIFNWLLEHGGDFGWQRLFDVDALQASANAGQLAIICAQRTDMEKPGHIQVVAPENGGHLAKRNTAGMVVEPLQSNAGSTNFTYGSLGPKWWQAAKFKQFGFWVADVG